MFIELVFCKRSICLSMALSMFLSNWGPVFGGLLYFGSVDGARGTGQSSFPLIMLVRYMYISHHCRSSVLNRPISSHLCKSSFLPHKSGLFLNSAWGWQVLKDLELDCPSQLPCNFPQWVASPCMKGSLCRTFLLV